MYYLVSVVHNITAAHLTRNDSEGCSSSVGPVANATDVLQP